MAQFGSLRAPFLYDFTWGLSQKALTPPIGMLSSYRPQRCGFDRAPGDADLVHDRSVVCHDTPCWDLLRRSQIVPVSASSSSALSAHNGLGGESVMRRLHHPRSAGVEATASTCLSRCRYQRSYKAVRRSGPADW